MFKYYIFYLKIINIVEILKPYIKSLLYDKNTFLKNSVSVAINLNELEFLRIKIK